MIATAAVLISRQPLRPCGRDTWVRNSIEAVKWVKRNGLILCSSCGMPTWDLLTSLGVIYGLKQKLLLPCGDPASFELQVEQAGMQFDLQANLTEFIRVGPEADGGRGREVWEIRDRMVIRSADVLLPISIRPGGHLSALVKQETANGRSVNSDYETTYQGRKKPLAYRIDPNQVNPELRSVRNDYLVHWTRASNGAWPGEKVIDYYRAVISSERYPRSAYHALVNMVSKGFIRASSKHMPGNAETVSFSGRAPSEMAELIRWRSRYREMSFEPYGIGIEKKTALEMGVRPVAYFDKDANVQKNIPSTVPRWTTQSRGAKTDWSAEDEYRSLGNFPLSVLKKSQIVIFCQTSWEADELMRLTGITTIPFQR